MVVSGGCRSALGWLEVVLVLTVEVLILLLVLAVVVVLELVAVLGLLETTPLVLVVDEVDRIG